MSLTACVSIPHFALAFELAEHPMLRGLPVVIGGSPEERKAVVDCSPEAAAEGVRVGMPLRQVLAVCHGAVFLAGRPAVYQERFAAICGALREVSPIVEPESLGVCSIDLVGVIGLYGGVEGTVEAIERAVAGMLSPAGGAGVAYRAGTMHCAPTTGTGRMPTDQSKGVTDHGPNPPSTSSPETTRVTCPGQSPRFLVWRSRSDYDAPHPVPLPEGEGTVSLVSPETECFPYPGGSGQALPEAAQIALAPRIGIADGKFPARVAASAARPGRPCIIPIEETPAFLAPLSIDLLPITEAMRTRLLRFGIGRLGELAALPVTAVQAQFGPEGRRAWALAGGHERERPRYLPPVESIAQAITLPAPATGVATLRVALDHLLAQAFARPERRGRGVRQVRLLMRLEGASRWERTVTLKDPAIDHQAAARALRPLIEGVSLAGAVEEVAVELVGFAAESGRQEGLFPSKGKRLRQLAASLKQLKAQYRRPVLSQVVEVEPWSRIPENRMALIDYDPGGSE